MAIASLAYSVYSTEVQAGAAYFSTLTRGWELALVHDQETFWSMDRGAL